MPYQECLKPCKGIYVDVKKSPVEIVQAAEYQILMNEYLNYTWFKINLSQFQNIQGNELSMFSIYFKDNLMLNFCLSDIQHNTTLKFVRIYFDSPTFDRITKDDAVKFTDILSAVGGTMGLLTGFSIISAVEILFYVAKLLLYFVNKQF